MGPALRAWGKRSPRGASRRDEEVGAYDLQFPFTGEIWFDELGNYRYDPKQVCRMRRAI